MSRSIRAGIFFLTPVVAILLSSLTLDSPSARAEALASYSITGQKIVKPLTHRAGDARRGRDWVLAPRGGNCLNCHKMPIPEEAAQGNLGPDLTGIGSRMDEGELRLRLVDPRRINPQTIMPSYYRTQGLTRVDKSLEGQPVLTAQEIEDVLAYLRSLK